MKKIYFDSAATTQVDDRVVRAMLPYFTEKYGNASSLHLMGEEARRAVEEARVVIARSIGAISFLPLPDQLLSSRNLRTASCM